MSIIKIVGKVLLIPLWFIISIIGAGEFIDAVVDLVREKIGELILG